MLLLFVVDDWQMLLLLFSLYIVVSTQLHQYTHGPSWLLILQIYWLCGHRLWDRKNIKNMIFLLYHGVSYRVIHASIQDIIFNSWKCYEYLFIDSSSRSSINSNSSAAAIIGTSDSIIYTWETTAHLGIGQWWETAKEPVRAIHTYMMVIFGTLGSAFRVTSWSSLSTFFSNCRIATFVAGLLNILYLVWDFNVFFIFHQNTKYLVHGICL